MSILPVGKLTILLLLSCSGQPPARLPCHGTPGLGAKGDTFDSGDSGGRDTASLPASDFELLFSFNVDDWPVSELAIAATDRMLDLHEQYGLPLDVFISDPMVQRIYRDAPALLERLRTAPSVAVSYHFRPPVAYAQNFDWLDLENVQEDALRALIRTYEEREVDLASGMPGAAPGGYQLLRDLLPYAPPAVGAGSLRVATSLVFAEKGATFGISHSGTCDLGDAQNSLFCQPMHVEVMLFDHLGEPACRVIEDAIADAAREMDPSLDTGVPYEGPWFVVVKWHDNDFFAEQGTWRALYYDEDGEILSPPYDLSAAGQVEIFSEDLQQAYWDLYEDALRCVSADPARFHPLNLLQVAAMLEAS